MAEFKPKTFDWGHGGAAGPAALIAGLTAAAGDSAYGALPRDPGYGGEVGQQQQALLGSRGSSLLEGNSQHERSAWSPHPRG